jgi:hypothetical protein
MIDEVTFCLRAQKAGAIGEMVQAQLRRAARSFNVSHDIARNIPESGLLWIQGNAAWFPNICRELRRIPPGRRPLVLIWHCEPLPPPRAAGLPFPRLNLREIAKIILRDRRATDVYTNWFTLRSLHRDGIPGLLIVSAPGRRQFLAERGIESHFVPFGYDPAMGRDLGLPRDIDALFIGSLDVPRRNRILAELKRRGVNLTAVGDWSNPDFWGERRVELLNRAKILLNFSRTPAEYSGARILLGLANKSMVISEPIFDPAPYVPGRHFVMAPVDEIPALVRHYLADETARARIVEEGHRLATTQLTMEQSVNRILKLAADRLPESSPHA